MLVKGFTRGRQNPSIGVGNGLHLNEEAMDMGGGVPVEEGRCH